MPQAVLNGLFKCEYNFFLFTRPMVSSCFCSLSSFSFLPHSLIPTPNASGLGRFTCKPQHHGRNSRQNIHMPLPSKIFRYPPARPFFFFLSWTPPFVSLICRTNEPALLTYSPAGNLFFFFFVFGFGSLFLW